MLIKRFFLIFLCSAAVYLLVAPLRGGYVTVLGLTGLLLALIVGCIFYFSLTLLFLQKYRGKVSKKGVIFAVLSGIVIFEVPVRIISHFKTTIGSLPGSLFMILAVFIAFGVFRIRNAFLKIVLSVLFFTLCIWFSYSGYLRFLHKMTYNSFTGQTEQVVSVPLVFQNENNEDILISDINSQYIVLDFWSSYCGLCFKMFPEVQKVYEKWNDDRVQLYSIFCRYEIREETPLKGIEILRDKGYTFPSLSIDIKHPVLNEMGVVFFPTVLIFDEDRIIIFRGSIQFAEKFLEKILGS